MSDSNSTRIDNVHVFDGHSFSSPQSLHIQGDRIIGESATGEPNQVIDAQGGYLLPGLIDSHVHLTDVDQLSICRQHGQTTVLDMACWPASKMNSYRHLQGLPQILSAGVAATSPGSNHSRMPGFPTEGLLSSPSEAEDFVTTRINEGSDYIKVVCDEPGPSPDLVRALLSSAHKHGKMAVAHAARLSSFQLALSCGFDVITHVPFDAPITVEDAQMMKEKGLISTPTLTMERAMAAILSKSSTGQAFPQPPSSNQQTETAPAPSPVKYDFAHAQESVRRLHQAGVPILTSTDANRAPMPMMPRHGGALLDEFDLLSESGLSNLDILRGATSLPAKYFGLTDRGEIKTGLRADLVLLKDDPLKDIKATRAVQRVWCGGIEFVPDRETQTKTTA